MSKQIWVDAYDEKWQELSDTGLSDAEVDKQCVEWAESASERLMDFADNLRKAKRENG